MKERQKQQKWQIDRQTDRQIDRQTDRQIDRQTDRQIDRQTDRLKDIEELTLDPLQCGVAFICPGESQDRGKR